MVRVKTRRLRRLRCARAFRSAQTPRELIAISRSEVREWPTASKVDTRAPFSTVVGQPIYIRIRPVQKELASPAVRSDPDMRHHAGPCRGEPRSLISDE